MNRVLNKIKIYLPCMFLLSFALVLSTGKYAYAVTEGVKLWAAYLLPSFLPYLVITAFLSSLPATFSLSDKLTPFTRKVFGLDGSAAYAFFMSMISGYPMGAKVVSDLKLNGYLSDEESVKAAILASTSSPAFTVGVVGNLIFHDVTFGVLLFSVNIAAAIITGLLFSLKKENYTKIKKARLNTEIPCFYDVTYSSVVSILVIGGIIAVFYLVSEILSSLGILSPIINAFSYIFRDETTGRAVTFGLLEFTRGLKILGGAKRSLLTLPVAAFLCGFSGVSALIQSIAYLKKAKINTAPFVFSKAVHAVVSFILALIVSLFL